MPDHFGKVAKAVNSFMGILSALKEDGKDRFKDAGKNDIRRVVVRHLSDVMIQSPESVYIEQIDQICETLESCHATPEELDKIIKRTDSQLTKEKIGQLSLKAVSQPHCILGIVSMPGLGGPSCGEI